MIDIILDGGRFPAFYRIIVPVFAYTPLSGDLAIYRSSLVTDAQLCVYDPSNNLTSILPNTRT